MTRAEKAAAAKSAGGKFSIVPGNVIAPEISATGGVKYRRNDSEVRPVGDKGLETDYKGTKTIDNVDLLTESNSIIARCYYLLDKHCTSTPIGYFATDEQLAALEGEIEEMREAARIFNSIATSLGSARRVVVEIFPLPLDVTNEKCVARIARSVHDRLVAIRDALLTGQKKVIDKALGDASNIERLATGIQADAVRFAIESAKEERSALLDRVRGDGCGADDVVKLAQLGKLCNLETIEATIEHFKP